jgi:hypothetical protein
MLTDTERRQRDAELMRQHREEYKAWLAEIEQFEDPDDVFGPSTGPDQTDDWLDSLTDKERWLLEEYELQRRWLVDMRAELYAF